MSKTVNPTIENLKKKLGEYRELTNGVPIELEIEAEKEAAFKMISEALTLLLPLLLKNKRSPGDNSNGLHELAAEIYSYLGEHHYHKIGTKENLEEANRFFNQAAAATQDCLGRLKGELYITLGDPKKDVAQTVKKVLSIILRITQKIQSDDLYGVYYCNLLARANFAAAEISLGIYKKTQDSRSFDEAVKYYTNATVLGWGEEAIVSYEKLAEYYKSLNRSSEELSCHISQASLLCRYDVEKYRARSLEFFNTVAIINTLLTKNNIQISSLAKGIQDNFEKVCTVLGYFKIKIPAKEKDLKLAYEEIGIILKDSGTPTAGAGAGAGAGAAASANAAKTEIATTPPILIDITNSQGLARIISTNKNGDLKTLLEKIAQNKNFPDNLSEDDFNDLLLAIYSEKGLRINLTFPANYQEMVVVHAANQAKYSALLTRQLEKGTKLAKTFLIKQINEDLKDGKIKNAEDAFRSQNAHSAYYCYRFDNAGQNKQLPEFVEFSKKELDANPDMPRSDKAYLYYLLANAYFTDYLANIAHIKFNLFKSTELGNLLAGVELHKLYTANPDSFTSEESEKILPQIEANLAAARSSKIIIASELYEIEAAHTLVNYHKGSKLLGEDKPHEALEYFKMISEITLQTNLFEYFDGRRLFYELKNFLTPNSNEYFNNLKKLHEDLKKISDPANWVASVLLEISYNLAETALQLSDECEKNLATAKETNADAKKIDDLESNLLAYYYAASKFHKSEERRYYATWKLGSYFAEKITLASGINRDTLRLALTKLIFAAQGFQNLSGEASLRTKDAIFEAITNLLKNKTIAALINSGLETNPPLEGEPHFPFKRLLAELEDGQLIFTSLLDAAKAKTDAVPQVQVTSTQKPHSSAKKAVRLPETRKREARNFIPPEEHYSTVATAQDVQQNSVAAAKKESQRLREQQRQLERQQKQLQEAQEKIAQQQLVKQRQEEEARQRKLDQQKLEEMVAKLRQEAEEKRRAEEILKQQQEERAIAEMAAHQLEQRTAAIQKQHEAAKLAIKNADRKIRDNRDFLNAINSEDALVALFKAARSEIRGLRESAKSLEPDNEFLGFWFFHDNSNNSVFNASEYIPELEKIRDDYQKGKTDGIAEASLRLALFHDGTWSCCNFFKNPKIMIDNLADFAAKKTSFTDEEDKIIEYLIAKNISYVLRNTDWMRNLTADLQITLAHKIINRASPDSDRKEFLEKVQNNLQEKMPADEVLSAMSRSRFWDEDYGLTIDKSPSSRTKYSPSSQLQTPSAVKKLHQNKFGTEK